MVVPARRHPLRRRGQVQNCGPNARWGATSDCTFVCDAATGPLRRRVRPRLPSLQRRSRRACGANGQWALDMQCGAGMCTGGACGPCTDGSTQCNAGIPQRCSGTTWSNQQPNTVPIFLRRRHRLRRRMQPGDHTCAGDVKRT
jgi:hypothetical protein